MNKIPFTPSLSGGYVRYDKDGYSILPYITKLDLKTFKLMSVLNPKYAPVGEGGDAEYEYGYMGGES